MYVSLWWPWQSKHRILPSMFLLNAFVVSPFNNVGYCNNWPAFCLYGLVVSVLELHIQKNWTDNKVHTVSSTSH